MTTLLLFLVACGPSPWLEGDWEVDPDHLLPDQEQADSEWPHLATRNTWPDVPCEHVYEVEGVQGLRFHEEGDVEWVVDVLLSCALDDETWQEPWVGVLPYGIVTLLDQSNRTQTYAIENERATLIDAYPPQLGPEWRVSRADDGALRVEDDDVTFLLWPGPIYLD